MTTPCRRSTVGRTARLTRFLAGRHPAPGMASVQVDGVVHHPQGRFSGTFAHAGRKVLDAGGLKRAASAAAGAQRCRRRSNDAGAGDSAAIASTTLHASAPLGLGASASEGEAGEQAEQRLMSDAELASDPAVCVFAVGGAGANSDEEFGRDVEVGLD